MSIDNLKVYMVPVRHEAAILADDRIGHAAGDSAILNKITSTLKGSLLSA